MSIFDILVLGIGLSMDAFAVSICKGLSMKKINLKSCSVVGLWFGIFQAIMPFAGFTLISFFSGYIEKVDHWISFVLLAAIGANMIKEALTDDPDEDNNTDGSLGFKIMLMMAIATSIDAFAAGAALVGRLDFVGMLWAVAVIGLTTFTLSAVGVKCGSIFGAKYKSKAELAGGIILILLGLKFLLEGLGLLP